MAVPIPVGKISQLTPALTSSSKVRKMQRGQSEPSRTVTLSQLKAKARKTLQGSAPSPWRVFVHIHTHTLPAVVGAPAQLLTMNRKFLLVPSPPDSEESKGCVKQTLLSKTIYEDRFLCIRDQSSESRDQLRHPRGVKNTP